MIWCQNLEHELYEQKLQNTGGPFITNVYHIIYKKFKKVKLTHFCVINFNKNDGGIDSIIFLSNKSQV